jgi:hypothetical protein
MHFRTGPKQRQGYRDERLLQREDQNAYQQGGDQRAPEVVHELVLVSGPMRLSHQAGRRHAQKCEAPIDGVEKDASHRHASQNRRARQMPGEDRVHHGKQRLGQVGKDERDGQNEDPPVPVGHFHE